LPVPPPWAAEQKWHLDEALVPHEGVPDDLWRAADQDCVVLNTLVQARRVAKAAKRFIERLQYTPRVILNDKLKNNGVGRRHVLSNVERR